MNVRSRESSVFALASTIIGGLTPAFDVMELRQVKQ